MANPTGKVPSSRTPFDQTQADWPLTGSAIKTYQNGQMIGRRVDGYAGDMDDAASVQFLGLQVSHPVAIDSSTDGKYRVRVDRPYRFAMPLSSGTASRATDLGKIAYAVDSGAVKIGTASLTYANPVGRIVDVLGATPDALTGAVVLLEPLDGSVGGARTLAATGNQTLTRHDLNKTIFVPNTAALSVTLPPVAQTSPGDRLTFVKTSADAAAVTLDGNASETIDGSGTYAAIDAAYDCASLVSTGTEWVILGRDIA